MTTDAKDTAAEALRRYLDAFVNRDEVKTFISRCVVHEIAYAHRVTLQFGPGSDIGARCSADGCEFAEAVQ